MGLLTRLVIGCDLFSAGAGRLFDVFTTFIFTHDLMDYVWIT